ncbi:MAG: hypothetical protein OEW75_06915, partial [Cyclobacteriaceae bacterium]|nr:hypothetical protein [Cyclobacteriaceae bacterium]
TPGHPELDIKWTYNKSKKSVDLKVTQKQQNLFKFTLEIAIDKNNNTSAHQLKVEERSQKFSIPVEIRPESITFDPFTHLLYSKN